MSAFVMPLVVVDAKNHKQMCDVCRSLAVGECWLLEKFLQKCPKCPTVPLSQISNKKCNKKDNILIYNNLDKITNST